MKLTGEAIGVFMVLIALAYALLGCLGCGSPRVDEVVFVELDGKKYTVPEMAQEIFDLRAELQEERDKQVPPATVCSCTECKCASEATYQNIRKGWSRLCQCEHSKKRPVPPAAENAKGVGRATLVEIKDVRLKPARKPTADRRHSGALNP
jgi:hypothetical protein